MLVEEISQELEFLNTEQQRGKKDLIAPGC